jgi:hypothetical protein
VLALLYKKITSKITKELKMKNRIRTKDRKTEIIPLVMNERVKSFRMVRACRDKHDKEMTSAQLQAAAIFLTLAMEHERYRAARMLAI